MENIPLNETRHVTPARNRNDATHEDEGTKKRHAEQTPKTKGKGSTPVATANPASNKIPQPQDAKTPQKSQKGHH